MGPLVLMVLAGVRAPFSVPDIEISVDIESACFSWKWESPVHVLTMHSAFFLKQSSM